MKYLIFFLIILFLLNISAFCFAQEPIAAPENLKEAESLGKNILQGFPEAFKKSWQEGLALWKKTVNYVSPWLKSIWQRISYFLGKQVEKKKPEIQEEFEKEKQEMKQEIPKAGKSLWQRFKELIY